MPPGINLQTTGTGTGTSPGTCGSGYTLSATKTGVSGEVAAMRSSLRIGASPPPVSSAVVINVPDGTGMGHWMSVSFPNYAAFQQFFTSVGGSNGYYPTDISVAQFRSAIAAVGGTVLKDPV